MGTKVQTRHSLSCPSGGPCSSADLLRSNHPWREDARFKKDIDMAEWLHIGFLLCAVGIAIVAAVRLSFYLNDPKRKRVSRVDLTGDNDR
jgi:hypothetical protein